MYLFVVKLIKNHYSQLYVLSKNPEKVTNFEKEKQNVSFSLYDRHHRKKFASRSNMYSLKSEVVSFS